MSVRKMKLEKSKKSSGSQASRHSSRHPGEGRDLGHAARHIAYAVAPAVNHEPASSRFRSLDPGLRRDDAASCGELNLKEIKKGGKTFVIVPKSLYKNLLEDSEMLDDIRAYDEAKKEIREYYPAELVHRLIKRENPVKIFRQYRGMTQAQLAENSGVRREMIAMIETGSKTGSVATLKKLAAALKVDLDEIA